MKSVYGQWVQRGVQSLNSLLMKPPEIVSKQQTGNKSDDVQKGFSSSCKETAPNRKQLVTSRTDKRSICSNGSVAFLSKVCLWAVSPLRKAACARGNESLNSLSSADNSRPFPKRQLIPKRSIDLVEVGQDESVYGQCPLRQR